MAMKLKARPMPPAATEYEVIDERAKPDMRGEIGGARVYSRQGKRYVKMTPGAAEWYLNHKTIRAVAS